MDLHQNAFISFALSVSNVESSSL